MIILQGDMCSERPKKESPTQSWAGSMARKLSWEGAGIGVPGVFWKDKEAMGIGLGTSCLTEGAVCKGLEA